MGDPDLSSERASRDDEAALLSRLRSGDEDVVLVVVNLDPYAIHEGVCVVPPALGLPGAFQAVDALTGETYAWGERNYVRLDPGKAHVIEVRT